MKKIVALILLVILLLLGSGFYINSTVDSRLTGTTLPPYDYSEETSSRYMSVEEYVEKNISELSPIKEQLGGTFYVTRIETDHGEGVVEYEDGHNAYTADFLFYYEASGKPVVTSFLIREN